MCGMRPWHIRLVVNLVNLSTLLGLLVALVARAQLSRGPRGLVFATSYPFRFPAASAFTVGNVIITRKELGDLLPRRRLLLHEERHAWQWMLCLGLPFLPLYLLASAYSLLRGGDPAVHNVFERAAGLTDGGYPRVSARARRREVRGASGSPGAR